MLTEFGKLLRKIRIDSGEIIKDMAEKLNVTASYLSAVETGKRNVPRGWTETIAKCYHLSDIEKKQLEHAADSSIKVLKLNVEYTTEEKRETAVLFAREFDSLDSDTIKQMKKLLQKNKRGEESVR